MSAQPTEAYPTRSPYRIEDDEGPQDVAGLRAALAAVSTADLTAFDARLGAIRTTDPAGLDEARALFAEYRAVWLSLVHPVIRAAVADSAAGTSTTHSSEEVWADYDMETMEPRGAQT
ncbi:hypothetical protein AB0K09_03620 [Streptomyces sp. NPDC049577]|uniref:hypothetical protein n=1 Tax=Streptomyces sp. NPDC049577 TaxID=3155153 RepID=UPI003436B489